MVKPKWTSPCIFFVLISYYVELNLSNVDAKGDGMETNLLSMKKRGLSPGCQNS